MASALPPLCLHASVCRLQLRDDGRGVHVFVEMHYFPISDRKCMCPINFEHPTGRLDAGGLRTEHDDLIILCNECARLKPLNLKYLVHGTEERRHLLPASTCTRRQEFRGARRTPFNVLVEECEEVGNVAAAKRLVSAPNDLYVLLFAHVLVLLLGE